MGYTLLEFDELTSTSDFLKENQAYFPHLTLIRSGYQTKGRGQFDRRWESNPNENILFSILLKNIDISKTNHLKMWILESLILFFHDMHVYPEFKEPNDLYVKDQKIAGILIETASTSDIYDYVIIGVGLNVNQNHFPLLQATSLKKLTGIDYSINEIFQKLIQYLMANYAKYLNE